MKFSSMNSVLFLVITCVYKSNAESIGKNQGFGLRLRSMNGRIFWSQPTESLNSKRRNRRGLDSFLDTEDYSMISDLAARNLRENTYLSQQSSRRRTKFNRIERDAYTHNDFKDNSLVSELIMHKLNTRPFLSRFTSKFHVMRSGQCDFDSECRWYCLLCHPLYGECKCINGICDCS